MKCLLVIATLLTFLALQDQNLPDAFYQLPEEVRKRATLIVTGTYSEGRSPCILRPDGTRAWTVESVMKIAKVHRGEAGGKYIYLSWGTLLKREAGKLTPGNKYLVLLRPNEESMKAIREGKYVPAGNALYDDEIIAVVELK